MPTFQVPMQADSEYYSISPKCSICVPRPCQHAICSIFQRSFFQLVIIPWIWELACLPSATYFLGFPELFPPSPIQIQCFDFSWDPHWCFLIFLWLPYPEVTGSTLVGYSKSADRSAQFGSGSVGPQDVFKIVLNQLSTLKHQLFHINLDLQVLEQFGNTELLAWKSSAEGFLTPRSCLPYDRLHWSPTCHVSYWCVCHHFLMIKLVNGTHGCMNLGR